MPTTTSPLISIATLTSAMRTALLEWRPRAVTLATYAYELKALPTGSQLISQAGITVQLPDAFQYFSGLRTALGRALCRTSLYEAGNVLLFRWAFDLQQFSESFAAADARISGVLHQTAAAPTVVRRARALAELGTLIQLLRSNWQLLNEAGRQYLAAIPNLAEDQTSLETGVTSLTTVASAFEQSIQDMLLQYALQPELLDLLPLVQQAGQHQLDQLHRLGTSLTGLVADCNQAHETIARLSGELLTAVEDLEAVASALREVPDAEFEENLRQAQLGKAHEQWSDISLQALTIVTDNRR